MAASDRDSWIPVTEPLIGAATKFCRRIISPHRPIAASTSGFTRRRAKIRLHPTASRCNLALNRAFLRVHLGNVGSDESGSIEMPRLFVTVSALALLGGQAAYASAGPIIVGT